MLDELHVASDRLQQALDRYLNACLVIKRCSTEYSRLASQPSFARLANVVINEISLLGDYRTKLHESKAAISQVFNIHPRMVPISKLPIDILIRIFKQLTEEEYEQAFQQKQNSTSSKYPMTLIHVCSNWRQVILQSPLLWSYITLRVVPDAQINKHHLAYVDFYSRHSKQALSNISITKQFFTTPSSLVSIDPFIGRIRSLRLRVPYYTAPSDDTRPEVSDLIAQCLGASNGVLERLTLCVLVMPGQHPFMESVSHLTHPDSLPLDLPHDRLEDILFPVTNLRLCGYFFNWESKAYHGLTALHLASTGLHTISESQLVIVLASSPHIQQLCIIMDVVQGATHSPRIHLSELEVLAGDTSLLQLIWPGSKELSLSIIWDLDDSSDLLCITRVKDFFSRANIVRLLSDDWYPSASDICHLLALAPHIRILALDCHTISGTLPEMTMYPSLEALYLLRELDKTLLLDMANKWNIKKIVFRGEHSITQGLLNVIDCKQRLEEELPELKSIRLEFIPCHTEDVSSIDFFTALP